MKPDQETVIPIDYRNTRVEGNVDAGNDNLIGAMEDFAGNDNFIEPLEDIAGINNADNHHEEPIIINNGGYSTFLLYCNNFEVDKF